MLKEKKRSIINRFQKEAVRPPKPRVVLMLALWGEYYISNFLSLGIRSLLSPGNIPALAEEYDCTFMFLTHPSDEIWFRDNPAFAMLTRHCSVEFVDISDLIFDGNYSTTLTLAYDRGMKLQGEAMCETYFIYLVSDYIMADGSMRGLMKYMKQGFSGITTGNFQIVEEETADQLHAMINAEGVLQLAPRELLQFSFEHLHPVTTANTVTQHMFHNTHTNRLFWHEESDCMIGCFYLRHMLCIKPEVAQYEIGSSCDYSFIPEFCPSGNVAHITDSDDYLVVELQGRVHETQYMRHGALLKKNLAEHLMEWTTADHRRNAHYPVIFHTSDKNPQTERLAAQAKIYIKEIESRLTLPPKSHRGHPYWLGAMHEAMPYLKSRVRENDLWRLQVEYFEDELTAPSIHRLRKAYYRFFGKIPDVYPWHPRWVDYAPFKETMNVLMGKMQQPVLILVDAPSLLVNWLAESYSQQIDVHQIDHFQQRLRLMGEECRGTDTKPLAKYGAVAVLITCPSYIKKLNRLLPLLIRYQQQDNDLCLWIFNERSPVNNESVQHSISFVAHHLTNPRLKLEGSYYVCGYGRAATKFSTECVFKVLRQMRLNWKSCLAVLALFPLLGIILLQNVFYRHCYRQKQPFGHVSSMFLRYKLRRGAIVTRPAAKAEEDKVVVSAA